MLDIRDKFYDGKLFAQCPKCGHKVWFDCLDRRGIDKFVQEGRVCNVCEASNLKESGNDTR